MNAIPAFADFGIWAKLSQFVDKPEPYQYGYEQGAWDAFASIDAIHARGSWDWDYFRKQMRCWDDETNKADQMHTYALEVARRSNSQGYAEDTFASILLASACGQ